jgi:muramidase (phage lysozyme)
MALLREHGSLDVIDLLRAALKMDADWRLVDVKRAYDNLILTRKIRVYAKHPKVMVTMNNQKEN